MSLPLLEKYRTDIVPQMMKRFGYKNPLQAPKLKKIAINMGIGEGAHDIKLLDSASSELAQITGQKPLITRAKKSVANFKIKKGDPIGCKVTLRGTRMFEFFDRFLNVALPRVRDFRGLSEKSFDSNGNYTIGIVEQVIFPEIDYDKVIKVRGMDLTFTISDSRSKEESMELLTLFGVPFKK